MVPLVLIPLVLRVLLKLSLAHVVLLPFVVLVVLVVARAAHGARAARGTHE